MPVAYNEAATATEAAEAPRCWEEAEVSTAASLLEEPEQLSAKEMALSLRQLEREVPLLAKAIISGSQELTVRLSEERSLRRAAEAVLDARIRHVEHQVISVRRQSSHAGDMTLLERATANILASAPRLECSNGSLQRRECGGTMASRCAVLTKQ